MDQEGDVLIILAQKRRNAKAARRFFRKLLNGLQFVPTRIVTDNLRSYGAVVRELGLTAERDTGKYQNSSLSTAPSTTFSVMIAI